MKLRHFSIRDLMWLTLVVGLALGWYLDHRKNYHRKYVKYGRGGLIEIHDNRGIDRPYEINLKGVNIRYLNE